MKKLLFATLFIAAIVTTAQAQNTKPLETRPMTKSEKEAAKEKKEADLMEAFTKAGLTIDEQKKYRTLYDESNEKAKVIKAEASLDDAGKKEKLDAIYKERNEALKSTIGDAKYKLLKAAQKAQKEAAGN